MNGPRPGRRRLAVVPVLASLALTAPGLSHAQDPSGRVTITGRVVDAVTRAPLEEVTVRLPELELDLRTDGAGQFRIRQIPLGTYELSLSRPGYRSSTGDFAVVRSGSFVTALTPLSAGLQTSSGRVVGRVVDAEGDRPLADAQVSLPALSLGAPTDADGRFTVPAVPPGRHAVEFSHLGYATVRDTITVESERTSDARVRLAVEAIDLEPIEVTVERREIALETAGFYERREQGWGRFVDLETIEGRNPSETSDLFTRMPGVTLVGDCMTPVIRYVLLRGGRGGAGGCWGGQESGMGSRCFPMVVLDGTVVHRDPSQPARIDHLLDPIALAGIEVYPSSTGVPMQYAGTGSSCGVVLLWTRR